jgi:hypothetical protein
MSKGSTPPFLYLQVFPSGGFFTSNISNVIIRLSIYNLKAFSFRRTPYIHTSSRCVVSSSKISITKVATFPALSIHGKGPYSGKQGLEDKYVRELTGLDDPVRRTGNQFI